MKQFIICILIILMFTSSWASPAIKGYVSSYAAYRVTNGENPRDDNEDYWMKFKNTLGLEISGETSYCR